MKNVRVLPSFERSVRKLSSRERILLAKALETFNGFILAGQAPFGFRLKKIDRDKYEFRVSLALRVVIKEDKTSYFLILVGSHKTIKRYLRVVR